MQGRRPPPARALIVLGLAAALAACSKPPAIEFPERELVLPDLSQPAALTGRVQFLGDPPERPIIQMGDAWCRSRHPGPTHLETVVVQPAGERDGRKVGNVRDVLVHVSRGLEAYVFDYEKAPALFDQKDCLFLPHVLAVRAWQPVTFRSSDQTSHNVNTSQSRKGQGFNRNFTTMGQTLQWQFKEPELAIPVLCNIHPWMTATIHVLDHPYFALTGEDGTFRLENVPPGTYTLQALHPRLGIQDVEVTVEPGATQTVDFVYEAR